jgi:hypothetical protein
MDNENTKIPIRPYIIFITIMNLDIIHHITTINIFEQGFLRSIEMMYLINQPNTVIDIKQALSSINSNE